MRSHILKKCDKHRLQQIIEDLEDDKIEEQCSIAFDDEIHGDDFFDDQDEAGFIPQPYIVKDEIQERLEAIEKCRKKQLQSKLRKKLQYAKEVLVKLQKVDKQEDEKNKILESCQYANVLEALINYRFRPVIIIKEKHRVEGNKEKWGETEEGQSWKDIFKPKIKDVIRNAKRTGRFDMVDEDDFPGFGSGFLISKDEVLTNRHVLYYNNLYYRTPNNRGELCDSFFTAVYNSEALYLQKKSKNTPILEVPYICPDNSFDFAIVKLAEQQLSPIPLYPHELSKEELRERKVYVLGHPYSDSRNSPSQFGYVMRGIVGTKRIMPGMIIKEGIGDKDGLPVIEHDCSTTCVASGSPLIDFTPGDSYGHVIGLHFGGEWNDRNYAIPSWEIQRILKKNFPHKTFVVNINNYFNKFCSRRNHMPIVFVHGVNVRKDPQEVYEQDEKKRNKFFRRFMLKNLSSIGIDSDMEIFSPYWGDKGAPDTSKILPSSDIENFGAGMPSAGLLELIDPEVISGNGDNVLAEIAQVSLLNALDLIISEACKKLWKEIKRMN